VALGFADKFLAECFVPSVTLGKDKALGKARAPIVYMCDKQHSTTVGLYSISSSHLFGLLELEVSPIDTKLMLSHRYKTYVASKYL
jgi:hypothetical protein